MANLCGTPRTRYTAFSINFAVSDLSPVQAPLVHSQLLPKPHRCCDA